MAAFPSADAAKRISLTGGKQPVWRPDGKELFFVAGDGKMMAVPVNTTELPKPTFEAGAPQALFDAHLAASPGLEHQYDISSDGKRFLINSSSSRAAPSQG